MKELTLFDQPPLRVNCRPVDPNVRDDDAARLAYQSRVVLELLQSGKRLTPAEAFLGHNISRLAARVYDLRRAGFDVKSEYNPGAKCSVYWMEVKQ